MSDCRREEYNWSMVPEIVDHWALKCAAPAWDLRRAVGDVYTTGDVGYYYDGLHERFGIFGRNATPADLALCKAAAVRFAGAAQVEAEPLNLDQADSWSWIKVAYSPQLRRIGEALNFFPGTYPGGIPNHPGPLASTLTSGLVGAGLGYAAGSLGERLLPESWGKRRLRRTLAVLGGMAGAAPGAAWMGSAARRGLSPHDGSDLAPPPDSEPLMNPRDLALKEAADALADVPLGETYRASVAAFAKEAFSTGFGQEAEEAEAPSVLDVNIDSMGHTLWEAGASPGLAGVTMGALHAAAQMPGGGDPGWITPNQFGRLAMSAGGGYAAGALAGAALGMLTGMPAATQQALRNSGATLGIVAAVLPKILGS